MSDYDPIVGVRDHLARIERKIDIVADVVFSIVTVLAIAGATLVISRLHLWSPLDWIVPPLVIFVIAIAVNGVRERYGKYNWLNRKLD